MKIHHDLLGMALTDFNNGKRDAKISIHSPDFEEDEIEVAWYFRDFDSMPVLEKMALGHCYGKILDVGAGAGSHALRLLAKGHDVTAMDLSAGACQVMKTRGLPSVVHADIRYYNDKKWDTLLMMMNGIGIFGDLPGLNTFLDQIPNILNPGGQVVFDSTNLIYLYENEMGEIQIDLNREYYGQISFQMGYREFLSPLFEWLYIDIDTLSYMAEKKGLSVELLQHGENHHYLARIIF